MGKPGNTCAQPPPEGHPVATSENPRIQRHAGFTLVELMIVIAIIGILLAIAVINFKQWNEKYTVEANIKEIYSILTKARNDAANSNTQVRVTLAANQVSTHMDTDGDGVVDAGEPTTTRPYPRFTITFTASPLVYDRRGITSDIQTIRITGYSASSSPGVDCIVVSRARINMGKFTGGACAQQ
ncbi:MAG: GspH/FimT family pseudopilin [Thermodesulfobacteriota bacterium]